jgi:hypothetical protein
MPSIATSSPRISAEGYVHKFRWESDAADAVVTKSPMIAMEEVAAAESPAVLTDPKEKRLLLGFLTSVIGLSGLLLGIAWLVQL